MQENHIQIFRNDGRILPPEQLATLRAIQRGESIYQHQEVIRHADGSSLPVLVVHQDISALKEAEYLKRNRTSPYANQKQKILHLILSFLAPR